MSRTRSPDEAQQLTEIGQLQHTMNLTRRARHKGNGTDTGWRWCVSR